MLSGGTGSLRRHTALGGLLCLLHRLLTRRWGARTPALLQLGLASLDLIAQAGGEAVAAATHLSGTVGRTPNPPTPCPALLLRRPLGAARQAGTRPVRPTGSLQVGAAAARRQAAAWLWAEGGVLGSPCSPWPAVLGVQRGEGPAVPIRGW